MWTTRGAGLEETGDLMTGFRFPDGRFGQLAVIHALPAAVVERAADPDLVRRRLVASESPKVCRNSSDEIL
jgi:hypothetical protein